MTLDLRLAPMAAVTNAPFRLVARERGAGLLTSEEIDARALVEGNARTRELARHLPAEHPIAMQLLGSDPDTLAEAARRLEAEGADAIDLNMGCPVAKIVAKGQGAALMRDPFAAGLVFRTMRKAIAVSLTIKIRGGWDERTLNAVEIARIAESEGVNAITVHPRTRSQQFSGRAPWEIIAAVVDAVGVPVTGNGDVRSHADARAMVAATGRPMRGWLSACCKPSQARDRPRPTCIPAVVQGGVIRASVVITPVAPAIKKKRPISRPPAATSPGAMPWMSTAAEAAFIGWTPIGMP